MTEEHHHKSYMKENKPLSPPKRYKIPPRSKKVSIGLKGQVRTMWGYKTQVELFEHVWADYFKTLNEMGMEWLCPFSHQSIKRFYDSEFKYNCCAHILPKSKYPIWRLNPDNVILVHPEFHRIVDQGRLSDRLDHPTWFFAKWDALVEQKKEDYKLFLTKHL